MATLHSLIVGGGVGSSPEIPIFMCVCVCVGGGNNSRWILIKNVLRVSNRLGKGGKFM